MCYNQSINNYQRHFDRGGSIKNINQIFEMAKSKHGACVAVACAADAHVLQAADAAAKAGIADFVLVGDDNKIAHVAKECGINLDAFEIEHVSDDAEACKAAVALVANGRANALMKGSVDTSAVMRAALDRDSGMRSGKKLSHIAVFELASYHKLLFVTDAAINIAPDLGGKKDILTNAIGALHNLGITRPKVALLGAKEKADEKMPVTMEYVEIVKEHRDNKFFGDSAIIDGPLALDNAVSAESCEIKGINSPVGGDADLLFCPDIEAGNILYKSLAFLAGAKNGGVVIGAKRPIILTSRADSAESKLISIALSVLF